MLDDTHRNHAAAATDAAPVTLHVGDKVDKYILQEQVSTGTLATVFRARDPILNRNVALKQIHLTGGMEDDQTRQRVRENALLQKRIGMAHPKHVVQIEDLIDESRGLFVISEFVNGPTLAELLEKEPEPMAPRRALGIMAAVAAALEVIHKAGLNHQDLKPANIFLPHDGGLKVADAGLAPAIDAQYALHGSTVRYMAPEVLRGEDGDGRADLYALGMISYEMLAGRNNFEQAFKTVLRDQRNQAMRWMKWHTNVRLQATPLSEFLPELPTGYNDLVARLLEKAPSARIGSAGELLHVIRKRFVEAPQQGQQDAGQSMSMQGQLGSAGLSEPGHTAALPTPSKLPLILSAMLAFWLLIALGVGGKMYLDTRAERSEQLRQANALMNEAAIALDLNEYERAQRLFTRITNDWPEDTELGFYARGGAGFAAAAIAMQEERHQDAAAGLRQLFDSDAVRRERVLPLLVEAEERAAFDRGMARIEELIEQRDIETARREMNEWQRLTDMPILPREGRREEIADTVRNRLERERQRISMLDERIVEQDRDRRAREVLERAQRLVSNNQRGEAINALQRELVNNPGNEAIEDMLQRLINDRDFELASSEGKADEATGNIDRAIRRYRSALAIREDAEIRQRLNGLLSQQEVAEARRRLRNNDHEGAFESISAALSLNPDNEEALVLQGQIETANEKAAHVRVAQRAERNEQWDVARRAWLEAEKFGPDDEVTAGIRRAAVNLNLQNAQSAIDAGELGRANDLLVEAGELDPYNARVFQMLEQVRTTQDYQRQLAAGDAAQQRGDYREAGQRFRDAQRVMDTAQVRQRIDDNEYLSWVARARNFLEREDYAAARAAAMAARRIRDSEEVARILAQIEVYLPPSPQEQRESDEPTI